MNAQDNKLTFRFERIVPASPEEAFDAWLSSDIPGTPWNEADNVILQPEIDGMFFWSSKGKGIYGRFTEFERPARMRHTWVSPNTLGFESYVTLTFEKHGSGTRMTLIHSELPDHELAKGHEKGWSYFLDAFPAAFVGSGAKATA